MKKSLVVLLAMFATVSMLNASGYYVVGVGGDWTIKAQNKMAVNPENSNEQMITMDLAENDEFKVVYSADDATTTSAEADWFPAGMNNNYKVTEAGNYTIYCRTTKDGDSVWWYQCLFVQKNTGSAIDAVVGAQTQSKKVMLNGTMYILRNGVYYTTTGAEMK